MIIGGHVDDDADRYAARQWVAGWYAARGLMPLVCVSDSRPWAKADAYNAAVGLTDADVVVLADGDSFAMKTAANSTTMLVAYAETTSRLLVSAKKYA